MLDKLRACFLILSAAVLILLLIPVCLCWARSYLLTDDLHYHSADRFTRFRTSGGGFWFETRPWVGNEPPGLQWQKFSDRTVYPIAADESAPLLERWGFLYSTKDYDLLLVAPYWSLVLPLTAVLVIIPFALKSSPNSVPESSHADR